MFRNTCIYLKSLFDARVRNQKGQAMVEYGLIIALIAVVVIVALGPLGTKIKEMFTDVAGSIPS